MTQRPVLVLLTFAHFLACGEVSNLGNGQDDAGDSGEAGADDPGDAGASLGGSAGAGTGGTFGFGGVGAGGGFAGSAQGAYGGFAGSSAQGGHGAFGAFGGTGAVGAMGAFGGHGAVGALGAFGGHGAFAGFAGSGGFGGSECVHPDHVVDPERLQDSVMWFSNDAQCAMEAENLKSELERLTAAKTLNVAPLAGTWQDDAGSDRVELVLDASGQGTLQFGLDEEVMKPGDEQAYLTPVGERDGEAIPALPTWQKGFRYKVYAENGRGSEMMFHLLRAEPWDEWCGDQAPIRAHTCYTCEYSFDFPRGSSNDCDETRGCFATVSDGRSSRIHCGRHQLCHLERVCACTEERCYPSPYLGVSFLANLDPVDTNVLRLNNGQSTLYLGRVEE